VFSRQKTNKHRLVAMGDSMAQGFKNGGIYRTDLSFPALLAKAFEPSIEFEKPSFTAHTGIPINMELLIRDLSNEFGDKITWDKYLPAAAHLFKTLRKIKHHWEGKNRPLNVDRSTPYHNQGIWGLATSDAWLLNERYCREFIKTNPPSYNVFNILPDHAMHITARLVLNPSFGSEFEHLSMIQNVKFLQDHGGIENLISCIGHNNIVGAVTNLDLIYSEEHDLNAPHGERSCTVFRPEHFEDETRILYQKIARIGAKRVFVPTLPYVTIPPATRGVNADKNKPRTGYFDYYSRFWIWDEDFDPDKHPHLTKKEAITLDQLIDQYNAIIREQAAAFGFHVVPVARYVQAAARRRQGAENVRPFPAAFLKALKQNKNTSYLLDETGQPRISTDYLRLCDDSRHIDRGGIFSLDGLHPSTIGYGLIANIYKQHMEKHGVTFGGEIDWEFIIENETLVSDPPVLLKDLRLLLRFLALNQSERFSMVGQNILQQILELFSARAEA
jgi:lysophospholipase L1-like esterase